MAEFELTAATSADRLAFFETIVSGFDPAELDAARAALGLVLQTSLTDTTLGRAQLSGAFGWGAEEYLTLPGDDIDSPAVPSGSYRVAANLMTGVFPSGSTFYGTVLVERYGPGELVQTANRVTGDFEMYRRVYAAGAWSAWKEVISGDFGIGGRGIAQTDLNDITVSAVFTGDSGTLNMPAGITNAIGWHASRTGTIHAQMLISRAGSTLGQTFTRATDGSTWSVWKRLDAERGSNANGEWVRFPDGTQICTRTVAISDLQIATAVGALYASATTDYSLPAAFVGSSADFVSASVIGSDDYGIRANTVGAKCRSSFTSAVKDWAGVRILNTGSVTSVGTTTYLSLYAIGRWF